MSSYFQLLRRAAFTSVFTVGFVISLGSAVHAQKLTASDGTTNDRFGWSVGLSGNAALVGASGDADNGTFSGSAYYFRDLNANASGATESVKLTASDGVSVDIFGQSVSLSGDAALAGASGDDDNGGSSGSAYYFRDLDTNTSGTATENVKLTASDGAASDQFGLSVALSGNSALVGASFDGDNNSQLGSAYYFRDLDTNTSGTATENVKLTASDSETSDRFGQSVSLFGDAALIGANLDDNDNGTNSGSAYYFRNLDANTSGAATENVKLTASDGAAGDFFGESVSLSGDGALVGAAFDRDNGGQSGSAYYFSNLDANTSGTATENVKLTASDGAAEDFFGQSVSLSGDEALLGARRDDDDGNASGSAYYFSNLDANTSGTATETLKLTASDGAASDLFGWSVSLSGDTALAGATSGSGNNVRSGSAYRARISNMTTLDEGNTSRVHSAVDFESRTDWIVGAITDNNALTLAAETTAEVDSVGRAIMIGEMAGSDDNSLTVEGTVRGMDLFVGSMDGNSGNQLIMAASGELDVDNVYLAGANELLIEGDFSNTSDLLGYLTATTRATDLFADDGLGSWELVTLANADGLILSTFDSTTGFTTIGNISSIPEPAAAMLLLGFAAAGSIKRRRKSV